MSFFQYRQTHHHIHIIKNGIAQRHHYHIYRKKTIPGTGCHWHLYNVLPFAISVFLCILGNSIPENEPTPGLLPLLEDQLVVKIIDIFCYKLLLHVGQLSLS